MTNFDFLKKENKFIDFADIAISAEKIFQVDKSKLAVQQGLQELEILKKSLMQQYFG